MRTTQLQKAIKLHRDTGHVFKGVFASNRLPKYIPKGKTVALIANMDPSHKPEQHWMAFVAIQKRMSTSSTPMTYPHARLPFTDL